MLSQLRPRSTTEIVDAAFAILRAHYRTLVTAGAIIAIPVLLVEVLVPDSVFFLAKLVSNLLFTLFDAAVILIVSDGYLGRTPDVRATLQAVSARAGTLIAASFFRGLLVGLGMVLLIVPGVIAFAWSFAMPMAVILEGTTANESFTRSRELVKGSTWRVLGTVVLAFLVMTLLMAMIGALVGAGISTAGGSHRIAAVAGDAMMVFIYPAVSVVATLLYYDLRIRKEGFDLEMMARELDPAVPVAAPATY